MPVKFIVKHNKFSNVLAKLLNSLECFFIFGLPVLMKFEHCQVIETPDIESEA
jgi:hypothetical protein